MAEKTEIRWAIVGVHGLYTGQWLNRCDAIAAHVHDKYQGLGNPPFEHAIGGKLSKFQKAEWERCRGNLDRAVKVRITYEVPDPLTRRNDHGEG